MSMFLKSLVHHFPEGKKDNCHFSQVWNKYGEMVNSSCQTSSWKTFDSKNKLVALPLLLLKKYGTLIKSCVILYRILDFSINLFSKSNISKGMNQQSIIFLYRNALNVMQKDVCSCATYENNKTLEINQVISSSLDKESNKSPLMPICHYVIRQYNMHILSIKDNKLQHKFPEKVVGKLHFVKSEQLNASFLCMLQASQISTYSDLYLELSHNGMGTEDKKLQKFNPFLDSFGFLRIAYRVRPTVGSLPYNISQLKQEESHNPFLLPKVDQENFFTQRFIQTVHLNLGCAMPKVIYDALQGQFFLPNLYLWCRITYNRCLLCLRDRTGRTLNYYHPEKVSMPFNRFPDLDCRFATQNNIRCVFLDFSGPLRIMSDQQYLKKTGKAPQIVYPMHTYTTYVLVFVDARTRYVDLVLCPSKSYLSFKTALGVFLERYRPESTVFLGDLDSAFVATSRSLDRAKTGELIQVPLILPKFGVYGPH